MYTFKFSQCPNIGLATRRQHEWPFCGGGGGGVEVASCAHHLF